MSSVSMKAVVLRAAAAVAIEQFAEPGVSVQAMCYSPLPGTCNNLSVCTCLPDMFSGTSCVVTGGCYGGGSSCDLGQCC